MREIGVQLWCRTQATPDFKPGLEVVWPWEQILGQGMLEPIFRDLWRLFLVRTPTELVHFLILMWR